MLDKSVPYQNIIMKIEQNRVKKVKEPALPPGFSFRRYCRGDEVSWAGIETSVLEFGTADEACDYFVVNYVNHYDALTQRCLFLCNQDGIPVATATAWYADSSLGHQASLHWVAVHTDYQGMGLGRSVVEKALLTYQELEPGEDIFLHTQTWSYPAVALYHKLGFRMTKTEQLGGRQNSGSETIYPNDFAEAMEILKTVMNSELFASLCHTAI